MLRDHFSPPLSLRRHWQGFHHAWATNLAADLNRLLPPEYVAEPNVQFGIEIDAAVFEESDAAVGAGRRAPSTPWSAPAPALTMPLPLLSDVVEVQVFDQSAGPVLAGAIELVSPANKDRPAHRDAFTSKCAALVQQGIGLVIVDIVTDRRANLHQEMLDRIGGPQRLDFISDLYCSAYHTLERDGIATLDIWQEPLEVGAPLVTMPLFLRGGPSVPTRLDETYVKTCSDLRIEA